MQAKGSFKCTTCGKEFLQAPSLQKHVRVHTGSRPYICDFEGCGKSFSQSSNLVRHRRIHTGEKPYVCKLCEKAFTSGSNLKQHEQIHVKDDSRNQYMCSICGKHFLYVSSLKKHLQNLHADTCGSDGSSHNWELYCTIIKQRDENVTAAKKPSNDEQSSADVKSPDLVSKKKKKRRKRPAKKQETKKEQPEKEQADERNKSELEKGLEKSEAKDEEEEGSGVNAPMVKEAGECGEKPATGVESEQAEEKKEVGGEAAVQQEKLTKEETKSPSVRLTDSNPSVQPCVSLFLSSEPQYRCQSRSEADKVSMLYAPPPPLSEQPAVSAYWMQAESSEDLGKGDGEGSNKGGDSESHLMSKLEERVRCLPTGPIKPLEPSEHHHIHCEFCGHIPVIHGNHIDYVHDAELHFVSLTGEVYPHKLEVSETNPTGCRPSIQYPWHANGPPSNDTFMATLSDNPAAVYRQQEDIEQVHEAWNRYSEPGKDTAYESMIDCMDRPIDGSMCSKFFSQECCCAEEVEKLIRRIQSKVEIYHQHSRTCGHPRIIHGDHVDYIVDGRLHFPHITHCDDHGPIRLLPNPNGPSADDANNIVLI